MLRVALSSVHGLHKPGGQLMQAVETAICCLGVQGFGPFLFMGVLGHGQLGFDVAKGPNAIVLFTCGHGGGGFEAQVDTYLAVATRARRVHTDAKIAIPLPQAVMRKRASANT